MCQVLGLPPTKKYQNEGGPGCAQLSEAIRTHSGEPGDDAWTFARAIMLNWIIGGTDAHAKNYSMLISAGGRARLAPLYDVASTLPYDFDPRKLKMATKIGGKYRLAEVYARQWTKLATELRLASARVLDMGKTMAKTLPAASCPERRRRPRQWARPPDSAANGRRVERALEALRPRPRSRGRLISRRLRARSNATSAPTQTRAVSKRASRRLQARSACASW